MKRQDEAPAPPPMGSLRLQLARADIARASIAVFSKLGADATRVEDLLAAADVARRTFYKHFRSKDDVLAAIYEMVSRELLATIEAHRDAGADPTAGVRSTLSGTYTASGDQISIRETGTSLEGCTSSQSGVYRMTFTPSCTIATLGLVSDACRLRGLLLGGRSFTRL